MTFGYHLRNCEEGRQTVERGKHYFSVWHPMLILNRIDGTQAYLINNIHASKPTAGSPKNDHFFQPTMQESNNKLLCETHSAIFPYRPFASSLLSLSTHERCCKNFRVKRHLIYINPIQTGGFEPSLTGRGGGGLWKPLPLCNFNVDKNSSNYICFVDMVTKHEVIYDIVYPILLAEKLFNRYFFII